MARDGQGARDYGVHTLPETNWSYYGTCLRCGAKAGSACLDLRFLGTDSKKSNWTPHVSRPLIRPLDASEVVRRAVQRVTPSEKRQAMWALNSISLPGTFMSGRCRWNLVAPCSYGRFRVTAPLVHKPWGRSTHQSSYLSHITQGVLFVWLEGRLIISQARWRCGARTQVFRFMDEPDSQMCPACRIERVPRERRE